MNRKPTYKELEIRIKSLEKAVSDHKKAEGELKLLRAALEQAAESFEIIDADGKIQYVNPSFVRTTGYQRKDILGNNPRILQSGKHGKDFYRNMWDTLTSGRVWSGIMVNRKKDGSLIEEDTTISPVKDNQGRITHYVAVKHDVTEKQSLERQLFQAQKMESLGTMVAGLAHEINNPINAIMLSAPLIKKVWEDLQPLLEGSALENPGKKYGGLTVDFLNENMGRLISDIELGADRISRLIRSLKNFAKITDHGNKILINVNEAVINALRLSQTTINKAGISIASDLGKEIPAIEGNLQNIEQIVMNLILNAVDAIEESGTKEGKIKVLTKFIKRGGKVFISVTDNGIGVDPAVSENLFDPFITSKQSKGGTGLGLSVTYNLVKAHDGEITFESEKGKGTTFFVQFPVYKVKKLSRILVVDDDEGIRKLMVKALGKRENTLIDTGSNGTEALIKLGIFRPDLLILDVFMPKMDGIEVCRMIKSDPKLNGIEVIIITGYPDHPEVAALADMGFKEIHPKPLDLPSFMHSVDRVLKKGK